MVILHVKRSDLNQFLYDTNTGVPIDELLKTLVQRKFFLLSWPFSLVNNLRLKVDMASTALEELASKGPMRPEALRGLENLDEYVKAEDLTVINGLKEMPPKTGTREVKDEHNYRTGWLVSEELCKQMLEEVMKGK